MLEIRAELEPKIGESLSLLTATSDRPLYKPGSIIVRFKPDIASSPVRLAQASNAAHTQLGATVTTDYSNIGLPGMQALHLPDGVSVAEAVQIYSRNPNVLYAEPNYYYYVDIVPDEVHSQNLPAEDGAERIPNDPEFGKLWGLHNTGQVISGRTGTVDADIDAPEAWSITTGSPDVIIAVIDTGVMYTHPDLAANIWKNPGEIPGNGIDDDHNGYIDDVYGWNFYDDNNDPNDLDGHGTHCAGTIAGVGNNTEGVAGVMWNAKIMSLQFLSPDGPGDTADAILAIQYATMMGADIISCSWGGGGYSQALKDAIDASPALVVCAAGNDGMDNDAKPSYPSSYTSANILAVAASNNIEQLASFSNIGATSVDVVAPGETIYSTYITHPRVTAFYDPMDSLNAWNADAPWGLNTTHYVSPPSSADDSPGGNYAPNTYAWLTTKNPIDLRGLQGTTLTFAARWELETGSDVLHVVSSPDDYDYYTHGYLTGSSDGEWGSITVPFDMYDGSQVYIGFLLQTDDTVQKDGVLIDDIRITVIEPGSVTAGYGYLSGTSMATPHVSGVAGLIRSINTSLSATEIKDAIINTVDKKPAYTGKVVSGGRVNAYSALNAVTPVIEPAPQADFTANVTTGPAPLAVQFTDTSTGSPTSWLWSFGDGATSTAQNPIHTYTTPGTYTVSLTATNAGGSSTETRTNYITVTTPPPVAAFTANVTTGPAPLAVQFTDISTGSPTSWLWNFGDGETSTAQNPIHTYTAPGTYTVSLTATNAGGSSTEIKTDYITVTTPPSVAAFTANVTTGPAPLAVQFTDISTGSPTSWLWSFGDGETSTAQNPIHTYTTPGTYTVSLTATNAGGSSTETRTNYITVTTPPPVAAFTANVTTGPAPLAVQFTDISTGSPTSWLWNFGDGATSTAQNPIHTYTAPGTYTVSLTATNAGGSSTETRTGYITVTPVAPFLASITVAPASATLAVGETRQFNATGYDQYGVEMPVTVAWLCSNETVGRIDNGLFTALAPGTALVNATNSTVTGSAVVTVTTSGSPENGSIVVTANVTGAAILLDGADTGLVTASASSVIIPDVLAGTHTVGVGSVTGYRTPPAQTVTVLPGGAVDVTFMFEPLTLAAIVVAPGTAILEPGDLQQFTAIGYDQYGDEMPIVAAWSCTNESVGTIDSAGLFTALSPGTVTVMASASGIVGTAAVTVLPTGPVLTSITLSPIEVMLTIGESEQFTALCRDQYGEPMDEIPVTWSVDNESVGTIDATGLFTATGAGTTGVTAAAGEITGSANVTVVPAGPAPIDVIIVSPAAVTLDIGCIQQFTATCYDADGTLIPGAAVVWTVTDGAVGRIDDDGLFTAIGEGTTTVAATLDGVTGTATVTVRSPPSVLARIEVCPPCTTLDVGETYRFAATGYDRFGNVIPDLAFTWSCSDPCVGSIDDCGLFTALAPGTATITASAGCIQGIACVAVEAPPITCIEISPADATLTVGSVQQFTATAYDQCGNRMDCVKFTWSCSDPCVGSIDDCGLFTALAPGTATITASAGCIQGIACVAVEAPPITLYADFSADVTCGAAPLTVRFTDCSAGCPASHAWEFGDGGSSTEQNPVHVYDTAGTYTVTLTVENAGGNDTCRRADYITVTEPAGPAPGHSGGSSSSSGGGSPPAIRAGASCTFGDLTGSAVTGVTLTASGDIERVMLAVKTARLPAGVEPPETPVYEYVEITLSRANPADIGNATIEFVVPMAWFEENGLAPDDAVLLHYVNGTWETLPTEYLGMEDGNCQFRATTEGFSYFAVSAAEGAPLAATTPVVEAVAAGVEETTTVPAATTVPATPLLFAPALAPFILLLLGGRRKN